MLKAQFRHKSDIVQFNDIYQSMANSFKIMNVTLKGFQIL